MEHNNDIDFEIGCIKSRLATLTPVLESTERAVRLSVTSSTNEFKIEGSVRINQILNEVEEKGLTLWNLIEFKNNKEFAKSSWFSNYVVVTMGLMYFVSLLLSIHAMLIDKQNLKIRVLNCLLKSYYLCIDEKQTSLEKAVKEYIEKMIVVAETAHDSASDVKFQTLKIEFYMLDMHASLLVKDFSMAKYYESKANLVDRVDMFKKETVFNICRTLFNDCLKLYQDDSINEAYYFLERCFLTLEKIQIDQSKPENKIKISTLIMLTKCCLKVNTEESIQKAEKMIKFLNVNEAKRIEAFKLQLELIQLRSTEVIKIEEDLMRFVISIQSDPEALKQLGLIFNSLAEKYPSISKNCLLYLLTNKMYFTDTKFKEVGESFLISLIWITTSKLHNESTEQMLQMTREVLELADKKMVSELNTDTSNSLIIMLFSAGKKQIKECNYNIALSWFECCMLRFLNKGMSNEEVRGKIQRCILQCCLEVEEWNKFDLTLNEMNEINLQNPITLYYRFVFLLKTDSPNLAALGNILNSFGKMEDPKSLKLLALCIIQCREMSTSEPHLNEPLKSAVNKLLERCFNSAVKSDDPLLVVALRSCMLIYGKCLELNIDIKNSIEIIVRSVNQMIKVSKKNKDIETDIEWFASNCFNYGLLLLENIDVGAEAILLFDCCIRLIALVDEQKNLKWLSKAIIFKNQCRIRTIRLENLNSNEILNRWNQILQDNKLVVEKVNSYKVAGVDEILLHCNLQIIEVLANTNQYKQILSLIKQKNQSEESQFEDDNTQINYLVEVLFDQNFKLESNNYEYLKQVLEIVFVERAFQKKYGVGTKKSFRWLYLLVNKLIDQRPLEDILLKLIKMFKEYTEIVSETESTIGVTESEMTWLAGICWNKGIACLMEEAKTENKSENVVSGIEFTNNMDVDIENDESAADSSLINDGNESAFDTTGKINVKDKRSTRWCETAILVAVSPVQKEQLNNMLRQL